MKEDVGEMKEFTFQVPLKYINTININTMDFSKVDKISVERVLLDTLITSIYINNNTILKENTVVELFSIQSTIFIKVTSIYSPNMQDATLKLVEMLDEILPSVTFLFNKKNHNKHTTQYKLTYDLSDVTINEKEYTKLKEYKNILVDRLSIRDAVRIQSNQTLIIQTEDYQIVNSAYNNDNLVNQILKCYVRALGDTDYISKYFNLFIIIETLEQYYKEEVDQKLVDDAKVDLFISELSGIDNELIQFFSNNSTIRERIKNTLKNITINPRGKKLIHIINEIIGIKNFKVFESEVLINDEFVKRLIKQRNQLFHAKSLNQKESEDLKLLVVELLILCELLIIKHIERANRE